MTASLHTLPGGERNPSLRMQQHLARVAKPEARKAFAELEQLLTEHQANRLLTNVAQEARRWR